MTFSGSINRAVTRIQSTLEEDSRTITKQLFMRIVKRTPVNTGRARANWNVSASAPDYAFTNNTDQSRALSEIAKVDKYPVGSWIYLSNGLPYIGLLEYGGYPSPPKHLTGKTRGGFSRQAPYGMVRITLAEFNL